MRTRHQDHGAHVERRRQWECEFHRWRSRPKDWAWEIAEKWELPWDCRRSRARVVGTPPGGCRAECRRDVRTGFEEKW